MSPINPQCYDIYTSHLPRDSRVGAMLVDWAIP